MCLNPFPASQDATKRRNYIAAANRIASYSSSATMKNSCAERSYSMRSTLGLQHTWQSST
jgi:hypothetical protein